MGKYMDLKLARLRAGHPPRLVDLFSGCGGISLGFQRAGFEILGGVEKDPRAAWTYAVNLHRDETDQRRKALEKCRDICTIQPEELLDELGSTDEVDVIVGGPPCQAYARVGRAKLRAINENRPEAFQEDERGTLFLQYLEYVHKLRPLALLVENVPDILSYGGRNIAWEIAENLSAEGYVVNFGLLNAASYGIPQMRRRFYLLAFAKELGCSPGFPLPTHRIESLPSGYREFESFADGLRTVESPFSGLSVAHQAEIVLKDLPVAVTAREAIGDLPKLSDHLNGRMSGGRRRFDTCLPFATKPLSDFAREMRWGWPGFRGGKGVMDQVIRLLPRDFRIFERMEPDDDYPKAHQIAIGLFETELQQRREQGQQLDAESTEWKALRMEFVPPYDPGKFPNKWRKMDADRPARTLLAHLSHDSYTHIHYDDPQARTISVREAARLQSFPDGFRFYEAMNPALKMIGNAVPPKMAFELARHMKAELLEAVQSVRPSLALAS